MWLVILIGACVAAYMAGRSRFWHVVFARLLLVACGLWTILAAAAGFDLAMTFAPIAGVCCGALILRWVFSPSIPQFPVVSVAIARIAISAIGWHIWRNLHNFSGREHR